ncbi:MAG: insulinase family protein [Clostridiales bacterium]|nr:insulinase family protein [Clostridiales bacterium]
MVFEKKYDNGLRLVVKEMQGLMSVTMGILVGTGACVETDAEDGISHFIEHMQFKGTKKRNAFEVSDAFDRIGAQVNAFTSKDLTCYYSKCTADHTADCFEILSDLFLHSTFPEEEMEREKGVVCEEISMNEDTPEDLCLDLLAHAFYGKNNYGRNILGSIQNVKGFTVSDMLKYKKARYCPENIVISFAGAIDKSTAQALVESYFGDLEKGAFEKRPIVLENTKKSLVKTKPIEQMHIGIAYPSVARGSDLENAVNVVNGVLGGSMSSRLFQEVREKRGLAYSVYSYASPYSECGTQIIYAGVNPAQKQQAYDAICAVVSDLKKNGITQEEFLRSREQMKSGLFFSNENSNSQMLLYGKYMLNFNKVFDFEERLATINKLTWEDTLKAIEVMFNEKEKAVSLVGNTKDAIVL